MAGRLRPLTDRIPARLPGPPILWIAAWALVPSANAGANLLLDSDETSPVWEQSDLLIVLNYAALSFAVVVTWGTECIPRRLPGLGLRPLGAVAFMGLWMLLVWLVPVAVTGLPDAVGLVIGLLLLGGGLGTFVFSRWGLHRQMVGVKEDELALARALYAEAYEPVRAARTLEAVEHQRPLLGAADTLEKLARAIHDWPVAEGTVGLGDRDRDERRRNRVRPTGPPSVGLLTRSRLPC